MGLVPTLLDLLPHALIAGMLRTPLHLNYLLLLPALIAAVAVWLIETWGRRAIAVGVVAALVAGAATWTVRVVYPVLDQTVSARGYWRQRGSESDLCSPTDNRSWRYGLNYYAQKVVPDCIRRP
jgi:hypothetical protein